MQQDLNNNSDSSQSLTGFIKDVSVPVTPASSAPGESQATYIPPADDDDDKALEGGNVAATEDVPATPAAIVTPFPGPPPPPPAPEAEPVFKQEESAADQPSGDEPPQLRKWSRSELDDNLEMFVNMRSLMQAELFAFIADDKDEEKYEYSEEQMQKLARVWAPYFRKHGNKIPDVVWIVMAEAVITGKLVKKAFDQRKINIANKKLANTPGVQQAMAQAVQAPVARKKYTIDENGFYVGTAAKNTYIKKPERTEKASLADIAFIIRDTDIEIVQKAFPGVDLNQYQAANDE